MRRETAAERRIDGDPEGDGRRQRHQHGRQAAPEIAGKVVRLCEFHGCIPLLFIGSMLRPIGVENSSTQ